MSLQEQVCPEEMEKLENLAEQVMEGGSQANSGSGLSATCAELILL